MINKMCYDIISCYKLRVILLCATIKYRATKLYYPEFVLHLLYCATK